MADKRNMTGFNTLAIHGGQYPDPTTGAVITPIYLTSTYQQEAPGVHKGYDYGRSHNATRYAFERALASLENGADAFAFASGLAAEGAALDLLDKDSHIIAVDDLYGGTYRLFEKIRRKTAGLDITYVDMTDVENIRKAIRPNTRMIWVETPSNPLLRLVDLRAAAAIAKEHKLIAVADNTFASPRLQKPLDLGFDIVLHSTTKYINGHSDIIGGALITRDKDLGEKIRFIQNASGAIAGAFDSFLAHRGLKTLGLRVQRQSESALEIARWLEKQSSVDKVIYPGLPSHPQHALAQRQMQGGYGGIIAVQLKGDLETVVRKLKKLQFFVIAESLGAVESLVDHPAIMTHASIPKEVREKAGITDGLIRLSVGIEDVGDLLADLEYALGDA